MKRDKFYDIAEKMYVEQFITVSEIGRRIGVHERTVRRWKAKGDWGMKRKEFFDENTITKEDIYLFARKMLADIKHDMDQKQHVDSSRLYVFTGLVEELVKKRKQDVTKEEFIQNLKQKINIEDVIDEELKSDLKFWLSN